MTNQRASSWSAFGGGVVGGVLGGFIAGLILIVGWNVRQSDTPTVPLAESAVRAGDALEVALETNAVVSTQLNRRWQAHESEEKARLLQYALTRLEDRTPSADKLDKNMLAAALTTSVSILRKDPELSGLQDQFNIIQTQCLRTPPDKFDKNLIEICLFAIEAESAGGGGIAKAITRITKEPVTLGLLTADKAALQKQVDDLLSQQFEGPVRTNGDGKSHGNALAVWLFKSDNDNPQLAFRLRHDLKMVILTCHPGTAMPTTVGLAGNMLDSGLLPPVLRLTLDKQSVVWNFNDAVDLNDPETYYNLPAPPVNP